MRNGPLLFYERGGGCYTRGERNFVSFIATIAGFAVRTFSVKNLELHAYLGVSKKDVLCSGRHLASLFYVHNSHTSAIIVTSLLSVFDFHIASI